MTPKSAKAKGRRLQQEVRDRLIEKLDLDPELVHMTLMGESGVDVWVAGTTLRDPHHVGIECKCQESLSVWASWKQCLENALKIGRRPALVIKRNNTEALVVISLNDWLNLLAVAKDYVTPRRAP